jgi:hypothetical protein
MVLFDSGDAAMAGMAGEVPRRSHVRWDI